MITTTDYQQQAIDFLSKTQTTMSVAHTLENNCPTWDNEKHIHGNEYKITFKRGKKSASIKFWNSYQDILDGDIPPSAYDVLANIANGQYDDLLTFDQWCDDYGYNSDSRKAFRTYQLCVKQAIKLKTIWSAKELELLQEIQ